ncbi:DUF2779 domain-containing protein [Alishewanella sp. HL-SH06]|uniref:DUF2779 domain-containing protein n=1 Tax=Alishewanella sp. HL-SH06 TaxID=3461144 RepID=UPI004041317A
MTKARYLTKSRFKLALECPTKLFYTAKPEYANQSLDDPFLQALADGGFQVGELAKQYFSGGIDIETLDVEKALAETRQLMTRDHVVIFEAAIRYQQLLIRVDVLVKSPGAIQLIEVKAKSYNPEKDGDFLNKSGKIDSKWKPYLYDVAFQKYVIAAAFPEHNVSSYLMLADKQQACQSAGLNQKFLLTRDERSRRGVKVIQSLTQQDLAVPLLRKVNVDHVVNKILSGNNSDDLPLSSFSENVAYFSKAYADDVRLSAELGAKCKTCEFKTMPNQTELALKSGFIECWQQRLGWQESDFNDANVLSLWNFRKADRFVKNGLIKLKQFTEEDIDFDGNLSTPLSTTARQWLQISKAKNQDDTVFIDKAQLRRVMASFTYQLHFIDFETSTAALPYFKGMVPYETVAFQFSHHVLHLDGKIEHKTQFLEAAPGQFPNFDFVRTLKAALSSDQGTIFRYSNHENTVLNHIANQLAASEEADKDQLIDFIKSITHSGQDKTEKWQGSRDMVDLLELVKAYYFDPTTKGSNSLKAVLPAILNRSDALKNYYSSPIYGTADMPSLNFQHHTWIELNDEGEVIDPYKKLPKLFQDASEHDIALLSEADELNHGGLALSAYGKLQFTAMSDYERAELESALLKYCELDTLAMVMLYQGWQFSLAE